MNSIKNLPNHRLRQAIADGNISEVRKLVLSGERDDSGGLHSYILNQHENKHQLMFELYEALFLNGHPYYFQNDDFNLHYTRGLFYIITDNGYPFERVKPILENILESSKDDPKIHAQLPCLLIEIFSVSSNFDGIKFLIPNTITQEKILSLYENSENSIFFFSLVTYNDKYLTRKEITKYLIDLFPESFWRGISKERNNDPHLISLAACHGDMEFIQWLIEKGSPINATLNGHSQKEKEYVSEEYSPLFSAIHNGHTHIIPELLKLGCDPNVGADDNDKYNLIGVALRDRYYDLVDPLIQAKTNIHHISRYGETPILLATRYGNLDNIKTLVEAGANLEDKDVEGYTPLLLACLYDNLEAFIYYREAGADMGAAKNKGTTIQSLVSKSEEGRIRKFLEAEELNQSLEKQTPTVKSSGKKIGPRL